MNKRGFTLMELLVYMAIVGIVVVIAGQVYSDSTKMRVRTQSMINASETAENVGSLLKDDIAQMGAKSAKYTRTISSDSFYVETQTYIDAPNDDFSSFIYKKGANFTVELGKADESHRNDSLFLKRIRYSDAGLYEAVEEISWYVKNGSLVRVCKSSSVVTESESCPAGTPLEVAMADNVKFFELIPSTPSVLSTDANAYLFPAGTNKGVFRFLSRYDGTKYFRLNFVPEEGGSAIMLSGFVSNYDKENEEYTTEKKLNEFYAAEQSGDAGSWSDRCTRMTLEKDVAYRLSFLVTRSSDNDKSQMFVPKKDHMTVGLRTIAGEKTSVSDFAFYPPMATEANSVERVMSFTPAQKLENVCIAFSIAAYSPMLASGSMNISSLKLQKDPDANYDFSDGYEPAAADKRYVRAFMVSLAVEKNKEIGRTKLVIPVPSNGNK